MFPPFAPVSGQAPIAQAYDSVPVGVIFPYAGGLRKDDSNFYLIDNQLTPAPQQNFYLKDFGWMVCDGRSVAVKEYPELYMVLGNIYGGDEKNFNLPNYQGQFLRGVYTDGAEVVPELKAASLENRVGSDGKTASEDVGSVQAYALLDHKHSYKGVNKVPVTSDEGPTAMTPTEEENTIKITEPTDEKLVSKNENRPTNTFVYFIIKYRNPMQFLPGR